MPPQGNGLAFDGRNVQRRALVLMPRFEGGRPISEPLHLGGVVGAHRRDQLATARALAAETNSAMLLPVGCCVARGRGNLVQARQSAPQPQPRTRRPTSAYCDPPANVAAYAQGPRALLGDRAIKPPSHCKE